MDPSNSEFGPKTRELREKLGKLRDDNDILTKKKLGEDSCRNLGAATEQQETQRRERSAENESQTSPTYIWLLGLEMAKRSDSSQTPKTEYFRSPSSGSSCSGVKSVRAYNNGKEVRHYKYRYNGKAELADKSLSWKCAANNCDTRIHTEGGEWKVDDRGREYRLGEIRAHEKKKCRDWAKELENGASPEVPEPPPPRPATSKPTTSKKKVGKFGTINGTI
ncbi:hypothetical protein Ddc_18631 [Ditylenchus destructor]|nr:hypothetical protein Ddc_18631 [Ditylenchus destructor]